MKIIDLDGNALLSSDDPTPFLNKVKKACDAASMKSSIEWKDNNKKQIGKIIRAQKEQEEKERLEVEAEEEARRKKKKRIIKHSVIILILFIIGVLMTKDDTSPFVSGISFVLGAYFWYWVWRKFKGK